MRGNGVSEEEGCSILRVSRRERGLRGRAYARRWWGRPGSRRCVQNASFFFPNFSPLFSFVPLFRIWQKHILLQQQQQQQRVMAVPFLFSKGQATCDDLNFVLSLQTCLHSKIDHALKSIAIHLPFASRCLFKSMPCGWLEAVFASPMSMAHTSHLYHDTFAEVSGPGGH